MTVRARTAADLPALVAGLRLAHEHAGYPSVWPGDPAAFVLGEPLAAWVAEVGGAVAGQVLLCAVPRPEPDWVAQTGRAPDGLLEVKRLFVAPGAQGRGVGRSLLRQAAGGARALGKCAALQVNAGAAPALALYDSEGWPCVGSARATWQEADGSVPTVRVYLAPEEDHDPAP